MRKLLLLLLSFLPALAATPTPSLVGGVRVSTDTTGTNTIAASIVVTNLNGGASRTGLILRDLNVTNAVTMLGLTANTPAVIGPDKTLTNGPGNGFSASFDTVADMTNAVVTPVTKSVLVNRRSTLVGDGVGGGQFYYDSASSATLDGGTVFAPSSGTGRYLRVYSGPLDARWFGARCNNSADDSSAIVQAIQALYPLGGQIYIPGKSLFNLTVATNQNITLLGSGSIMDFNSGPPTAYWKPYDATQPLIKLGNDSTFLKGFAVRDATLFGNSAATAGIYLAGGSFEADMDHITVWKFKTNFLFKAGSVDPTSLIRITHFNSQPDDSANARAIYAYMPQNQASYTTAIYFGYGHINGPSGSGSCAVEVDGTAISLSHVYIDVASSGKGVKFSKTETGTLDPYIDASDLTLDSDNSSDVLVNVNTNDPKLETWIKGTCSVDGLLQTLDTVTHGVIPGTTRIPYQSELSWPQVAGQLSLSDGNTTLWQGEKLIYNDGSLVLDAETGNAKILSANNVTLQPTNGGVILKGGASGVLVQSANVFMDNGRGLWFADPLGTNVNVLSSSGYNIQLHSEDNITVTPATNLVVTPGQGIIFNGGTAAAFSILGEDVYMDNQRSLLWKDLGGTYRQAISMVDTNFQVLNTAAGKLVVGANDATYGLLDLWSGGALRWEMDTSGDLQPQGKYDIGNLLNPAGKGYFTNLNIPKVSAILGTDTAGNLTNITAASIVGATTNYTELMLGNPNSAVVTGSTNFFVYPEAATLKTVTFHLLVTSGSGSVTADLKKNGTTVLSAPVSIAAGSTNATATISVSGISANDRLAGEITAAGSSAYGALLRLGTTTP